MNLRHEIDQAIEAAGFERCEISIHPDLYRQFIVSQGVLPIAYPIICGYPDIIHGPHLLWSSAVTKHISIAERRSKT